LVVYFIVSAMHGDTNIKFICNILPNGKYGPI